MNRTKIGAALAGAAAGVVATAAILLAFPATAETSADSTTAPSDSAQSQGSGDTTGKQHTPETLLTGTDAEKATVAANKAAPGGTIIRVETDSDGGGTYEAHVRKSDGTEVVVEMDASFNVTGVNSFNGGHGRGGTGRDSDSADTTTPPASTSS